MVVSTLESLFFCEGCCMCAESVTQSPCGRVVKRASTTIRNGERPWLVEEASDREGRHSWELDD